MVAPVLLIGSAIFCAISAVSAATGKKASSHFTKMADVAGDGRVIPMSDTQTKVLYIVRDMVDSKQVINVLDGNKLRIYSFERVKDKLFLQKIKKKQVWQLITASQRTVAGTVCISQFKNWVEFPNKIDVPFRMVKKQRKIASQYQYFKYHRRENARFRWSRTSLVLDRVTATTDPCVECKQRVASARKLAAPQTKKEKLKKKKAIKYNKYVDYEITYDTTLIDRELLIATAFISIMSQWRKIKSAKVPSSTIPLNKKKVMLFKKSSVSKVKRVMNTGVVISKNKNLQNVRKTKIAKSMMGKLVAKKPTITRPQYFQGSCEVPETQDFPAVTPYAAAPISCGPGQQCAEGSIGYYDNLRPQRQGDSFYT